MKLSNTSIKDWYTKSHPSDELGEDIDPRATFDGLFRAMDNYTNVYDYIGVGDSVVRKRVFARLAEIMEVDYDYVYTQWLLTI